MSESALVTTPMSWAFQQVTRITEGSAELDFGIALVTVDIDALLVE